MEFNECEKEVIKMMLKIMNNIFEIQDNCLYVDTEFFSRNDFYALVEKLGIEEFM